MQTARERGADVLLISEQYKWSENSAWYQDQYVYWIRWGNGLSENQFGFRKGRSTVDAIQAVVNIATNARKGTGKRKGFDALISIDIRNAFNTARWNICIKAMMRKKISNYLLRMIDDYLSNR